MSRLERIFSLYVADSDLSKLNRAGLLSGPALELVELLSICSRLHARTDGAFDPTVQTLWSLYARQFAAGAAPTDEQVAEARTRTGWRFVDFSHDHVGFGQSGMSMTLNGVAQGFIADKVTAVFRRNGVSNVLVNTGEIAALGSAPDAAPWPVRLGAGDGREIGIERCRDRDISAAGNRLRWRWSGWPYPRSSHRLSRWQLVGGQCSVSLGG